MNHEKLKDLIKAVPICEEGKKAISELLKEAVGYVPPDLRYPKVGEVWTNEKNQYLITRIVNDKVWVLGLGYAPPDKDYSLESLAALNRFIYSSIEEYIKTKQ